MQVDEAVEKEAGIAAAIWVEVVSMEVVEDATEVGRRMPASLHLPGYAHILHIRPNQLPRSPAEVRIQTR